MEETHYDSSRGMPRRRVKTAEIDEQPIFLRKAYHMICACPPEIGGWSDEGDTIIVKDVKLFAEKVIPTVYRHNNFASFVRQLNFYGFRKVRSESLEKAEWWIFRHPSFLRDQPNLISEIKRSAHFAIGDGAPTKEVTDLKNQVDSLNERLINLTEQFQKLSTFISEVQPSYSPAFLPKEKQSNKKRKLTELTPETSVKDDSLLPYIKTEPVSDASVKDESSSISPPALFRQMSLSKFDFDYFIVLDEQREASSSMQVDEKQDSHILSVENSDGATDDLVNLDYSDDPMCVSGCDDLEFSSTPRLSTHHSLSEQVTIAPPGVSTTATNEAASMQDLTYLISNLSPDLKERFVDKLAETMGTQIANRWAEASSALSSNKPANVSVLTPNGNHLATLSTPLPPVSSAVNKSSKPVPMQRGSSQSIVPMQRQSSTSSSSANPILVNGEYFLPSGAKAPEIAIPLASAALSAFILSTVRQLSSSLNQPSPISSENVSSGNDMKSAAKTLVTITA
eukprot:CAMPEP_0202964494 /NCGR_PEP_ID=MMETSP1396-20130829/8575_1 /ASSEMBLY_ACC=CAM_ASM_000872 /TAXON_ID= /ORGANISM="Pseudokeronopsis sp., Strain Brazil" /LENGTH=509 /DNA_ID=CAMNT_0049686647 /DNA_START=67 /DNA_END=1596 /DNA_ORIENTATION=+